MGIDRRLKIANKNMLDREPYSRKSFKFGSFLNRMQGIEEDFLGASSAAIGSNKSAISCLKLGTMQAAYIANDAAAKPSIDGKGLKVTGKDADNDGVLVYSEASFSVPEASSGDKIVFESIISLLDVSNQDEAGFIISNESTSNLDADTKFLASNTFFGVNINKGSVELAHNLNAGTVSQTATGIILADGEDLHIKIEINDERKASIYINGSVYKSLNVMTFDAADSLRPVFGILNDAAAAGRIDIRHLSIYKVIA